MNDQPALVRITQLGVGDMSLEVAGSLTAGQLAAAAARLDQLVVLGFDRIRLDVSPAHAIDDAGASLLHDFISDASHRGGAVDVVDETGDITELGWSTIMPAAGATHAHAVRAA